MSSPSGSPFADVIQSLAGLHQEHHKALMDMRADQERRFCALVQNQREDRELFRSWMDREVRAGESPTALAPPTHMPVQKMGPQDDPEAFLDLFEKTAAACGWPQLDWPVRLIPLLTGEGAVGGAAAASPEPPGLRRPKASHPPAGRPEAPSSNRQRFRSLELGENGRPFVMAHQLREACRRWLLAGEGGVDQIIDRVVLEQFIARLPTKTAQWVSATVRRRWTWPSNSPRTRWWRGHGVGETLPVRLSLSPLPFFFSPYPSCPVPCRRGSPSPPRWRGGPAPESTAARANARGGGVGRCYSRSPGLSTPIPLSPFPPLGWRGSLGRPAGVAGTRATLSIVVR